MKTSKQKTKNCIISAAIKCFALILLCLPFKISGQTLEVVLFDADGFGEAEVWMDWPHPNGTWDSKQHNNVPWSQNGTTIWGKPFDYYSGRSYSVTVMPPWWAKVKGNNASACRLNGDNTQFITIDWKNWATVHYYGDLIYHAWAENHYWFNIDLQVSPGGGYSLGDPITLYYQYVIFGAGWTRHEAGNEDQMSTTNSFSFNGVNILGNSFNWASPPGNRGMNRLEVADSMIVNVGDIIALYFSSEHYVEINPPPNVLNDNTTCTLYGEMSLSLNPIPVSPQYPNPRIEFSLDIGSDAELSDPNQNGNEVFDPGDAYLMGGPFMTSPQNGVKNDATIFGHDPWPVPGDVTTNVPCGSNQFNPYSYFNLNGMDNMQASLLGMNYGPGEPSIPWFADSLVFPARHFLISYDDDGPENWSYNQWGTESVPVNSYSPMAWEIYGTTARADEVIAVDVHPYQMPAFPFSIDSLWSETDIHPNLAPNPDTNLFNDNDVNALNYFPNEYIQGIFYFSCDSEARYYNPVNGEVLNPGSIYQLISPGNFVEVVNPVTHLGLTDGTDISAFSFGWVWDTLETRQGLALMFSVDIDDWTTPLDESGGLDPSMIYYSFLNGTHSELLAIPLNDNIDAITIIPHSYTPYPSVPPSLNYDFGDAPDPDYPTLLASNGARHAIDNNLFLGQSIDPEPDGQPCPFALGDDQDGNDDEDGVRFLNSFVPGQTVDIEFTVQGTGFINAWFDWDTTGSWADPDDHAIVDLAVNTGVHVHTVNVPATAATGMTFARFRLSSLQGLSYDGLAPDGEVEDYRIRINEPMGHKMHFPQYPDPAGWDVNFTLPAKIGDDWMCSETGYVEDFHFWVSWKNDLKPFSGVTFIVEIYSDLPAHLSPTGYSMPDNLLWVRDFAPDMYNYQLEFIHHQGWFDPYSNYHNVWDHHNCYRIDIDNFSDPFLQEAGEIYWLVISAQVPTFKGGDEEVIILTLQNIDPQTQPYDVWYEEGFALSIQHHPFAPDLGFSLHPDGGVGLSPALLSLEPVDVNYTNADFLSHIEIDIIELDAPGSTVAELYFDDELVGSVESTQMGAHTLVLENPMSDAGKQPVTVSFSLSIFGYDLLVAEVAIAYVALPVVNYQIGWKTSLDHFMDVAVWESPDPSIGWELLLDPITQNDLSLAFVINGSPAEEPEIPDFLTIDDIIVALDLDTCFNAEKTIFVHNLEIEPGGRVDLIAGESIIFYPGTKVHHGGEMWARITKDGTFCGYFNRHFLATEPEADSRPATSESEVLITDEVQEQPEAFFKLYPNPTHDRFTVELFHYEPGKPVTIEVYSMLGERILHEILPADRQHMFSLEAQHPGLYLVRVLQGDRTGVERLILR